MRYRLLCVGRIRERALSVLVDDFAKRLTRYHALDIVEVPDARIRDTESAMRNEGQSLLRRIDDAEPVWLLERSGNELSSEELAARIDGLEQQGLSRLTLVIAGPYGSSHALRERANFRWSLSRLTFLHEWTRALVVEQLYRAAKIARGEPYHH